MLKITYAAHSQGDCITETKAIHCMMIHVFYSIVNPKSLLFFKNIHNIVKHDTIMLA